MKRKMLMFVTVSMALLLFTGVLYAGNGDLIVNGNLGVGTSNPGAKLDVNGGVRAGSSAVVTTCNSTTEGTQRYNYSTHAMEYCNATTWVPLKTVGLSIMGTTTAVSAVAFNVSTVFENSLLSSNPVTSAITIPTSGLYDIQSTENVCQSGANTYVSAGIIVDGVVKITTANKANECGSATVRLALRLNAGQVVTGACWSNQWGLTSACSLILIRLP